MRNFTCFLFFAVALPMLGLGTPATAQDDRGLIVGFLEDQLSGAGRDIRITGFAGALSSNATLDELTIADDDGVWLTLRGVVLNWSRSALLRGRIEVKELSAAELILPRLPPAGATDTAPAAEATPFKLPQLPVSINIEQLSIGNAQIGAPVLGQEIAATLAGALSLDGGAGAVKLTMTRQDARRGAFGIDAAYSNETNQLRLDLSLSEDAGGLATTLLGLPGAPSLEAEIKGDGPLTDFSADLRLATDGADRLAGRITLGGDDTQSRFDVNIGGDVTALFLPQYQAFFGPDVALIAKGSRNASGILTLDQFDLQAASLALNGRASLSAQGAPLSFNLTGSIADPRGAPVLLPGSTTRVKRIELQAQYDAARGRDWIARISGTQIVQSGVGQVDALTLSADGTLSQPDEPSAVAADLSFAATGLLMQDAKLSQALGAVLDGAARVEWAADAPLIVRDVTLGGTDYGLTIDGQALIEDRGLTVSGSVDARFGDLSRLSALAGQPLEGEVTAQLSGSGDPIGGVFDGRVRVSGSGLRTGIAQLDPLLADGVVFQGGAARGAFGLRLDAMQITATGVSGSVTGLLASGQSDLELSAQLDDISAIVPQYSGPVKISGLAREAGAGDWQVDVALDGPYALTADVNGRIGTQSTDIQLDITLPDISPFAPEFSGAVTVKGALIGNPDKTFDFDVTGTGPFAAQASLKGSTDLVATQVTVSAMIKDLSAIMPDVSGPVAFSGTAQTTDGATWQVDFSGDGPFDTSAQVSGTTNGTATQVNLSAALRDLSRLAPGVPGNVTVNASAQTGDGASWLVDMSGTGPWVSRFAASGTLAAQDSDLSLSVSMPNVGAIAPEFSGPLALSGTARDIGAGQFAVKFDVDGPYGVFATTDGIVGGGATAIDLTSRIPDISPFAPSLSGGVTAKGRVTEQPDGFAIDLSTDGPGTAETRISGTLAPDASKVDLGIVGRAPLALLNRLLEPRAIRGTALFDLKLRGAPGLKALSGTITTSGTRVSLPTLEKALEQLSAEIKLLNGTAGVFAQARFSDGGQLRVTGPIGLGAGLPADLTIALSTLKLRDPALYDTQIDGQIRLNGPLSGGAEISGALTLGETEIRIPETGLSFGGDIPEMTHRNLSAAVRASQLRAGIEPPSNTSAKTARPFPLNITINAPNRIFLRGRGLDAELGGQLRVTGTSAAIIPIGQFDLVRGRLDLLGKRLTLDEGRITLAGGFVPTISLVTRAQSGGITAITSLSGPATDPVITFTSEPELPEDEVLARLFFGKGIESLSALQAAQMAVALRTLAGKGGVGTLAKLRNSFGLDDLDVSTDESGNTSVRAGAYITENAYTDVTTNSAGDSEINLKIDLSDTLTLKGAADSTGNTSIGIFLERDY
jgi:translocation and assembly module TamB